MKIAADEKELIGTWIATPTGIEKDPVCKRIDALVAHHLKALGTDRSGWDTLLMDPDDGRLWELVYRESTAEGGGPPRLIHIGVDAARTKYGCTHQVQAGCYQEPASVDGGIAAGRVSAQVSVSDPWEVASRLPSPMHGIATLISGVLAIVRLDPAVSMNGIVMCFASATPRHVGTQFVRNGQFPANIVFSNAEPLDHDGKARAEILSVATVGTVSFSVP